MSTVQPRQLVIISFESRLFAQEALMAVTRLESEGQIVLHDAVFVSRGKDGEGSVVEETRDPDTVESAFGGGFWGLLFGTLLAGPVGAVIGAGAGAGAGALAAALIDYGVKDETVKQLRASLPAGRTALALLVSHLQVGAVLAELHRFAGAELVQSDFSPALEAALRESLARGPTASPVPAREPDQVLNDDDDDYGISQYAR